MNNKHLGASFDEFLKEEGLYSEATSAAIKRVLAYQAQRRILHPASKTSKKEKDS